MYAHIDDASESRQIRKPRQVPRAATRGNRSNVRRYSIVESVNAHR